MVSISPAVHFDVRAFLRYNGILAGHSVMIEQTVSLVGQPYFVTLTKHGCLIVMAASEAGGIVCCCG